MTRRGRDGNKREGGMEEKERGRGQEGLWEGRAVHERHKKCQMRRYCGLIHR